jgi:8-oxo-dGTP pyrophosphatase MutT (NUDIX family)
MKKEIENIPDCFYRVSIKALILDEQKRFLLALERKGVWELPGGGLDFGEKPEECLVREIKEETGLEIASISKLPVYYFTEQTGSSGVWFCHILHEVKVKDLAFTPSDECVELRFFSKEEALKENTLPHVTKFVEMYDPSNHK